MRAPKVYRPKPQDEIRRNMAAIRSHENRTEAGFRKMLHAMGFRYRKYRKDLPGCPDIVFPRERIAVFVDGDYWHGRVLVERGRKALRRSLLTPNREYWIQKLKNNARRDREATQSLEEGGWLVLRFWESDIKRDTKGVAKRVSKVIKKRREQIRLPNRTSGCQ